MFNNITSGLLIPTQEPLDLKGYSASEAALKNLGTLSNLAYTYYDGLIVYCVAERTRWEWREVKTVEPVVGLLTNPFTYPAGLTNNGIIYSNKVFNFFPFGAVVAIPTLEAVLNAGNIAIDKNIVLLSNTDVSGTYNAYQIAFNHPGSNLSLNYQSNGIFAFNAINNGGSHTGLQFPVNAGNNVIFTTPIKPAGNYVLATINDITSAISTIAPPFEKLDEGNGFGIRLRGKDSTKFGNIGADAFDISYSSVASTTKGATGTGSFAVGDDIEMSGYGAYGFGTYLINNGVYSFSSGINNKLGGYASSVFGVGHDRSDLATFVIGQASTINSGNLLDWNAFPNKDLFIIGNGTITNNDDTYTVLTRSNAFAVRYNGVILAPSLTNALITAETTGKVLVTRDYLNSIISSTNLQRTVTAGFTLSDADNNYTIIVNNSVNIINIIIPVGLIGKLNVGFIQQGTGDVDFLTQTGVTINTPVGLKIKGQHYCVLIEQVEASNVYQLSGNTKV